MVLVLVFKTAPLRRLLKVWLKPSKRLLLLAMLAPWLVRAVVSALVNWVTLPARRTTGRRVCALKQARVTQRLETKEHGGLIFKCMRDGSNGCLCKKTEATAFVAAKS
jgi:hypothetical protein